MGRIVKFTYIRNPNSIFGLKLGGATISMILTIVAFVFVIYLFVIAKSSIFTTAISFITGGALGNLTDRVLYGEVVDFIDIGYRGFRWATFNVADSFVTIGIILVIIHWFIETRNANSDTASL